MTRMREYTQKKRKEFGLTSKSILKRLMADIPWLKIE